MNLKKLFDKIAVISKTIDPNIGHVLYGDVYELNHIQTIEYPAVVVTVGNHGANLNDYTLQYRLNIFYVDRLTDDKGNKIDVHANSIVFLNTLLKELDEDLMISEGYEIINFNERFNDVCSGAYVNVRVGVPIEICDMPSIEYITNLKDLKVTENGLYKAPYGTAYKNIDVDVPKDITLVSMDQDITENGEYVVETPEDADGIYEVNIHVDVTEKIPEEYYIKLITGHLDEPLIIPEGTTAIARYAFAYLNYDNEEVCPICVLPEGSQIRMNASAFRFARIKKIIVPSDNVSNNTFIFADNTDLEEVIWKSNSYSGNMCANCINLKRFIFESTSPYIAGQTFQNCTGLEIVDLSNCTRVPTLAATNAFTNVPTTCEFRVPAALYDQWIRATNWSTLYAQGYKFTAV